MYYIWPGLIQLKHHTSIFVRSFDRSIDRSYDNLLQFVSNVRSTRLTCTRGSERSFSLNDFIQINKVRSQVVISTQMLKMMESKALSFFLDHSLVRNSRSNLSFLCIQCTVLRVDSLCAQTCTSEERKKNNCT